MTASFVAPAATDRYRHDMKRGRTVVIKLVVFLLLGAVVNVAVAWACAWIISAPGNTGNPLRNGFTMVTGHRPMRDESFRGVTHWHARRLEKPGVILSVVTVVSNPSRSDETVEQHPPPLGWPSEVLQDETFEQLLPVSSLANDLPVLEATLPPDSFGPGFFVWDGRGWPVVSLSCRWPWFDPRQNPLQWPSPQIVGGISVGAPTDGFPWPYGVNQLRGIPLTPVWPGFVLNTLFYTVILWLLWSAPFATRRLIRKRRGRCARCGYDLTGVKHDVCPECGAKIQG